MDPTQNPSQPNPLLQAQQQVQQGQQVPTPEDVLAANDKLMAKKEDQQKTQNTYSPAILSQTMAMLNPQSTAPQVNIGKAIATPAYAGLCLKWVDDQQGNTNRQPTAIADFQSQKQAGNIKTDIKNIPLGARVYFAPDDSNGQNGHVGIAQGNGKFISATDNGIKTFSIADWERYTGQSYIGYAPAQGSKS